jgi:RND superfamily putative drug exporter
MGIVLGIAVLLDTFVVRLVLVPVLLRLAGASAWHVPRWADRILPDVRVGQSPSGCRGLPAPRHM